LRAVNKLRHAELTLHPVTTLVKVALPTVTGGYENG
jgi:hypothetical protein